MGDMGRDNQGTEQGDKHVEEKKRDMQDEDDEVGTDRHIPRAAWEEKVELERDPRRSSSQAEMRQGSVVGHCYHHFTRRSVNIYMFRSNYPPCVCKNGEMESEMCEIWSEMCEIGRGGCALF